MQYDSQVTPTGLDFTQAQSAAADAWFALAEAQRAARKALRDLHTLHLRAAVGAPDEGRCAYHTEKANRVLQDMEKLGLVAGGY